MTQGREEWVQDEELSARAASLVAHDRRARDLRREIFDAAVINDSCWHILQDLFAAYLAGEEMRTKNLNLTTGLPPTTVLRYLDHLETFDAVRREGDPGDNRVTLVSLSPTAVSWMYEYYVQLARQTAVEAGSPRTCDVGEVL